MDLKLYWGVSVQALIYKAWEIGSISDRGRKYYYVEMSKRGWREKEPIDIPLAESASSLRDLLSAHLNELRYTSDELSIMLGLPEEDARVLYPMPSRHLHLRVVAR
jgi:Zn-dependent peptidase ImmA (M78 family)